MQWQMYWRAVFPIGILYSLILSLSNATYMFLSVSFIQMLKALTPASVYSVGCVFGTEQWSWRLALNLVVVVVGVLISAYGVILPLMHSLFVLGNHPSGSDCHNTASDRQASCVAPSGHRFPVYQTQPSVL